MHDKGPFLYDKCFCSLSDTMYHLKNLEYQLNAFSIHECG